MQKYDHKKIEAKWQKYWATKKTFTAKDTGKDKKFVLVEFPYPSGAGLHMGHLRPYVAADTYARFQRLLGKQVLFPIGWDAFGLPAENYAIKMGVHPSITTKKNVANAKKQMQSWGLSFDWAREINTTDPSYYKWTQWLFLQFYKKGLAYEATGLINWCPKDKTGLANEEVIDGKCERCGTTVEKKELRQWYLRITEYAEKLLAGLKELPEWPEPVKLQQENWIGKKTGINIEYEFDYSIPNASEESLKPESQRDPSQSLGMVKKPNYVLLHGRGSSSEKVFLPWLKSKLEEKGFYVQVPDMPGGDEPSDLEQAEYVLKNCKINENTVILGHSFGGIVAMRLLEKGVKVSKVIFVATPYLGRFSDGKVRKSVSEAIARGFDFSKIKQGAKSFISLSDETDHIVPLSDGEELAEKVNGVFVKTKAILPHFNNLQEPEILRVLLPKVVCFTTRPDTNFGATFVVLGPEHPLLSDRNILNIEPKIWEEILKYQEMAKREGDLERTAENRKKTGVFTGLYLVNTLNNYKMPLYVSDYVLGNVGTGAVVGVPAHDKRDFEFAQVFNIPVVRVVQKDVSDTSPITTIDQVQEEEGTMVNSGFLNGMDIHHATEKIMDYMEEKGYGKRVVNYKLRDWVFSRQRYWGEPIPIIHCEKCGIVPVPEKDLPVKLPPVKKYEPTGTGESPLVAISKWVNTKCPNCKAKAKRETNTMPQWAGSSWYWLRYTDPKNKKAFASLPKQKFWTPVDVYFGGMEHTTLHLLYSRFWNLFLYDQKLVTQKEPYKKRQPHGIVLASDGEKMSKSRGNVVDPQILVKSHGADTVRMYEMFLGPHEDAVSWNDQGIVGVKRFLDRVWNWALQNQNSKIKVQNESEKLQRELHKLIKKVTENLEGFHFNTCISAFMEFHNSVKDEAVSVSSIKIFLILLYPFAPHICDELNFILGNKKSLQHEKWPKFDPSKIVESHVEVAVQVNGKFKGKIQVENNSSQSEVEKTAKALDSVAKIIEGQTIKRVIFVPNRLINLVI